MSLEGKKILFIGIGFYDYEKIIQTALLQRGANVNYLNSAVRPFFYRLLLRLHLLSPARYFLQGFQIRQIKRLVPDNDIVFIIKGEGLSQLDIDLLQRLNPQARFILYLWDSLVRHGNKELLLKSFNNIWSFDRKDCEENPQLKFRPLFYRNIPAEAQEKYVLSFIGWLHSDRLKILRGLSEYLKQTKRPFFLKLYIGKFSFFVKRYLLHVLTSSDSELLITKPLLYDDYQKILSESLAVLDIAHPLQSGLTIRTLEALAAGCYLYTTNPDIANYTQISPSGYTVVDRDHIKLPVNFDKKMKQPGPFYEYFSLDCFINQLFADE